MSMDSINSWVDMDEVKKIANHLVNEQPEAKEWEAEDFQGFAIADEKSADGGEAKARESAERSLAEASSLAKRAGLLRKDEDDGERAAEGRGGEDSEDPVERRFQDEDDRLHASQVSAPGALGKIDEAMRKSSGATGVCVVDRDGDVLHDSMGNEAWTRIAVLSAAMAATPEAGSVFQRVSGAGYLQLIPAATSRGGVVIGLLVPRPVLADVASDLAAKAEEIANR